MRVSTNLFYSQGISSIQKHQAELVDVQLKLSTNKRVNNPSDDPVGVNQINSLTKAIKTIEQFEKNGDFAKSQLQIEETQITESIEITQRARELTIRMMNDTFSVTDRQNAAEEIGQIILQMRSIVNSTDSQGGLLFAGSNSDADAAFVDDAANSAALQPGNQYVSYIGNPNAGADFDARANFGARFVQIGFDSDNKLNPDDQGDPSRVRITDNGGKVFNVPGATSLPAGVDPTLINVLVELKNNLDQGLAPPEEIGTDLLASIKEMTNVRSEVGSRLNRVESQAEAGKNFSLVLTERRSDIEDMDIIEGSTEFTIKQNALQVAQQVFARVQNLSLFQFLQ